MKTTLLFTAAATLALGACSGSGTGTETGEAGEAGTSLTESGAGNAAAASAEAAAPADAQRFVDAIAASDMFEIESGKLAQQSAKSQEVKDFAAMLVKDHTKSSADLKAAAGSQNLTVNPQMTARQRSDLDALKSAGDNFDRTFKQQQVAAHTAALSLLQGHAERGEGTLKDFAAKTAPVVEGHLKEARTLP
ncbi:DUF4142 domain-containing protein [Tsuneonella sp. HG249]